MKFDVSRPGFALSIFGHGTLLAALLLPLWWLFSQPADDSTPEAVPIETISQDDFNQIMKGEKSSKEVTKEPTTKADKVAQVDEQHAQPPDPEVRQETPPPPPPKPAAPTPPAPPPPPPPPPPVPEPPQRPVPPAPLPPEAPTPPVPTPKPAPIKADAPAPTPPERDPDAEVDRPAPPPPPRPVPKPPEPPKRAEAKPAPAPPPKPVPTPPAPPKVAEKAPPTPPRAPERPAPRKPDPIAKLAEQTDDAAEPTPEPRPAPKAAHHAPHAKPAPAPTAAVADAAAEPADAKAFDPTDISRILNREPSGAPPSTGRALSKVASRGATSGTAPKMSPSQSDALDGLLADQFKQCWSYLGLDHGRYIPEIKVAYAQDGSLLSEPQLLNRPGDPSARSLAESALRAVRQCNPLHIPSQFAPFYDQWRSRILRFDPAEMSG